MKIQTTLFYHIKVEKLLEIEKDEWTKRFLHFTHTQLNLISHMMTEIFDYDVIDLEDFLRYDLFY